MFKKHRMNFLERKSRNYELMPRIGINDMLATFTKEYEEHLQKMQNEVKQGKENLRLHYEFLLSFLEQFEKLVEYVREIRVEYYSEDVTDYQEFYHNLHYNEAVYTFSKLALFVIDYITERNLGRVLV